MDAPVVFIVFNRPELTRRVFAAIARARPRQLFIIADGPRADVPQDSERCSTVRNIVEEVNWECEVHRNYSDANLGCKLRVSSGLNWVFQQCEAAIILEDDCLPEPTFFQFCDLLLDYYANDERVMVVSGTQFCKSTCSSSDSYSFSIFNPIWGWATWRRAWRLYDKEMSSWKEMRQTKWLSHLLTIETAAKVWSSRFDEAAENRIDTWDYAWTFSCWLQHGLTIVPKVNLVTNLGFGSDSTHTGDGFSPLANLSIQPATFPLLHPSCCVRNYAMEQESWIFEYGRAPGLGWKVGHLGRVIARRARQVIAKFQL